MRVSRQEQGLFTNLHQHSTNNMACARRKTCLCGVTYQTSSRELLLQLNEALQLHWAVPCHVLSCTRKPRSLLIPLLIPKALLIPTDSNKSAVYHISSDERTIYAVLALHSLFILKGCFADSDRVRQQQAPPETSAAEPPPAWG